MNSVDAFVSRFGHPALASLRRVVRQVVRKEFSAGPPSGVERTDLWFECSAGGWFRRVVRAVFSRLVSADPPEEKPAQTRIRSEVVAALMNSDLRLVQSIEEGGVRAVLRLCELTEGALSCTHEDALDHVGKLIKSGELAHFDGRGELAAWIYATRPRDRHTVRAEPRDPGLLDRQPAGARPVWRQVSQKWEARALGAALVRLPEDEARMVLLRECIGLSYTEIAEASGLAHYETARRRIRGALERLQEHLRHHPEKSVAALTLAEVLSRILPE